MVTSGYSPYYDSAAANFASSLLVLDPDKTVAAGFDFNLVLGSDLTDAYESFQHNAIGTFDNLLVATGFAWNSSPERCKFIGSVFTVDSTISIDTTWYELPSTTSCSKTNFPVVDHMQYSFDAVLFGSTRSSDLTS